MNILVCRPEPGAGQTAMRLARLGHRALVAPVLAIAPTGAALPEGPFQAIAFTSVNGVKALAARPEAAALLGLPAFAVGARTAREARQTGFLDVTDCDGDAAALAGRLAAALPPGARVLHATGEERAADLGGLSAPSGLGVALAPLYRAVPAEALDPAAAAALAGGRLRAALHYSPRSAGILLHLVSAAGLGPAFAALDHLCLSAAVAAPLEATGLAVRIAAAPNEADLLALLPPAPARPA